MVAQDFNAKVVYLDAAPLIYYIEEHPDYLPKLDPLFWENGQGHVAFVTSSISLLEVLVGPVKHGLHELVYIYQQIFKTSAGLSVHKVDNQIATTAARLRAFYNLAASDSLQAATAIETGADYFLTNDKKLRRLQAEIPVVTLDDL